MERYNHTKDREILNWATPDGKKILVKNLSNIQLEKIIEYIRSKPTKYKNSDILLDFLETEQVYRENNEIVVPDNDAKLFID